MTVSPCCINKYVFSLCTVQGFIRNIKRKIVKDQMLRIFISPLLRVLYKFEQQNFRKLCAMQTLHFSINPILKRYFTKIIICSKWRGLWLALNNFGNLVNEKQNKLGKLLLVFWLNYWSEGLCGWWLLFSIYLLSIPAVGDASLYYHALPKTEFVQWFCFQKDSNIALLPNINK